MSNISSSQPNLSQQPIVVSQVIDSTKQVILVSSTPTNAPTTPETGGLNPLLMYGGVAVAVILAMAYFSQIQLKSITELMKSINKKPK